MLFTELGLKEPILRGLEQLGYEQTTPIQEQTITAFSSGKDIVGQSQTGTGKTAAFTLPLLNSLNPDVKKIQALILVPTRELAMQTQEEFFNLGRYARIRALAAYGGRSIMFQKKLLQEGMHVAVCTPGRAMDLIERKFIDPSLIEYFVLDEVDRMLDMGFIDDVEWIRKQCPNVKQTMLFSATITPEVKEVIRKHLQEDYHFIQIEPEQIVVDRIDHAFTIAPHVSKTDYLVKWIESHKDHKIIIFTQTKYATADIADFLYNKGYDVAQLSGDMEQRDRNAALKAYKENKVKIMVATDVASRGLNMKDIDLVINFDVPQDPESYVHRIGRTARAGKSGKAIMFVTESEMKNVQLIERRNKLKIKQIDAEGNEVERKEERRGGSGRGGRFGSRGGRFGRTNDRGPSRFVRIRSEEGNTESPSREPRREQSFNPSRMRYEDDNSARRGSRYADRGSDRGSRYADRSGERQSRSGFGRVGRPSSDRGNRYADRGGERRVRPERPSTKSLMEDFLPSTKPERGSYWGRE